MRRLFDEDFNQRIVRGLLRRLPKLQFKLAHDPELAGKDDDDILEFAAVEGWLVVGARRRGPGLLPGAARPDYRIIPSAIALPFK